MTTKKNAILSLISIFLIGMVVGMILQRTVLEDRHQPRKHKPPSDFFFQVFTKELSLSTTQQDSLKILLANLGKEYERVRIEQFEQHMQIRKNFENEFKKILDDDQKQKYNKMIEDFDSKMKNDRPPREPN